VVQKHVVATGYNGSMPGVAHCTDEGECYRRKIKGVDEDLKHDVCRAIHAEANALAHAARLGIPVLDGTVYCTLQPCYVCVKLMASAGIRRAVYETKYESPDQVRDRLWRRALQEAGIQFQQLGLSEPTKELALRLIREETSPRRLASPGQPSLTFGG
jgi:dCMP deaminase